MLVMMMDETIKQEAEMIRLYFEENKSPAEIAETLNIRKKGNNHFDADGVLYVIDCVKRGE